MLNQPGGPAFYGTEIAFANLASADERTFFANLGTNFDLARFEVDCLADRGARLMHDAALYTAGPDLPFTDFVRDRAARDDGRAAGAVDPRLHGRIREEGDRRARATYLDIGVQASALISGSDDIDDKGVGPGVVFRATRPNGWGVVVDVGGQSFPLLGPVGGEVQHIGDVRLFGLLGGIGRTRLIGRAEATIGISAGDGIGRDMTIEPDTRDAYGRQGVFAVEGEIHGADGQAAGEPLVQPLEPLGGDAVGRRTSTPGRRCAWPVTTPCLRPAHQRVRRPRRRGSRVQESSSHSGGAMVEFVTVTFPVRRQVFMDGQPMGHTGDRLTVQRRFTDYSIWAAPRTTCRRPRPST